MATNDLNGDLGAVAEFVRAFTVGVVDGRRGAGAGVLWNADGLIVTNAHVVRGKRPVIVLPGGRRTGATLLHYDQALDLASLQLDGGKENLSHAIVRDSAQVIAGEIAVAVGNPFGLTGAVSAGLVQRTNKRWVIADVRLAPGNSGGPLTDSRGRVIGINSMVAGTLAFAVASSAVQTFLRAGEQASRAA